MSHSIPEPSRHRLVFIAGLHRSGTTLLEQLLAASPEVSGLRGADAPHDEGQHIQDALPTAMELGGPGRFAFSPEAHLTETSPMANAGVGRRLLEAWSPYWDLDKRVLVEKSPPNLLRLRLLQSLFPEALFVVIVRHPIAVAYATQPWSGARLGLLLRHWIVAHEIFEADRKHLRRLFVLRYEDLVADTAGSLARLDDFVGIEPHETASSIRAGANLRYLRRWKHSRLIPQVVRTAPYRWRFGRRVADLGYGYSLRPGEVEASDVAQPG